MAARTFVDVRYDGPQRTGAAAPNDRRPATNGSRRDSRRPANGALRHPPSRPVSRVRTLLGRRVRLRGRRRRVVGGRVAAVCRSHCTARETPHRRTPTSVRRSTRQRSSPASNTSDLDEEAARAAAAAAKEETGLVADEVVRFAAERVLDAVLEALQASAGRARAEQGLWAAARPRNRGTALDQAPVRCSIEHSAPTDRTGPPRPAYCGLFVAATSAVISETPPRGPSRPREALIPALAQPPFNRRPKVSTASVSSRVTAVKFPTGATFSPQRGHVCHRLSSR
jgi:hypothetical protein